MYLENEKLKTFASIDLEVLEDNEISFEHLPSGIDSMSIVVSTADLSGKQERVVAGIGKAVKPDSIHVEDGLALLAVVGRGMVKTRGTAARVFDAISRAGVNIRMIDQGSSEISIIVGVEERDFDTTLRGIYNEFVQ